MGPRRDTALLIDTAPAVVHNTFAVDPPACPLTRFAQSGHVANASPSDDYLSTTLDCASEGHRLDEVGCDEQPACADWVRATLRHAWARRPD